MTGTDTVLGWHTTLPTIGKDALSGKKGMRSMTQTLNIDLREFCNSLKDQCKQGTPLALRKLHGHCPICGRSLYAMLEPAKKRQVKMTIACPEDGDLKQLTFLAVMTKMQVPMKDWKEG